jgi:DNA-binding HxlR family transcriptional regulator
VDGSGAEIVALRSTPFILLELLLGSQRFGQLRKALPSIPRNLLCQRLAFREEPGLKTASLDPAQHSR